MYPGSCPREPSSKPRKTCYRRGFDSFAVRVWTPHRMSLEVRPGGEDVYIKLVVFPVAV